MRKLKYLAAKTSLAFIVALFSINFTSAQKLGKTTVENAINSKSFVFKAQTVVPMSGSLRYLTSDYDVRLKGDSIVTYLPYFGRAYSVTYGERGGIDFTSTKFDYKVTPRKRGGWDVSIKPNDASNVQELNFFISENGSASLQVTSQNKQPISFNGYIAIKK